MTMFRFLSASVLALSTVLVAGCGGSLSGVQAQAPAIQQDLAGTVQSSGEYTLYRGTGYIEGFDQHVEPLWTISLQQGQKVGFRWVVDEAHKYDPEGAFHLVAFAGGEVRDLGSFRKRDMKYAWAGSHADAAGFFGSAGPRYAMEAAGIE
jgi:hypothetical protein